MATTKQPNITMPVTTHIRSDHISWACGNRPFPADPHVLCLAGNKMENQYCQRCGSEKVIEDTEALNQAGDQIGKFIGKNEKGEDVWEYWLVFANGHYGFGGA